MNKTISFLLHQLNFQIFLSCLFLIGLLLLTDPGNVEAAPPAEFEKTQIVSGLNSPTAFRFMPDGRIFIAEKGGAIKSYANGVVQPNPIITLVTLQTDFADERGLLGLEPDPDYLTNHFLYVSYTTAQNRDRLSRITISPDGNSADPASELVLLESDQDGNVFHHGGEVRFGPDGKLYWAMGINTYNPNSQNLGTVHGKLHRINKDGTIPADNPFINTPGALPSIWAYGLRNPFRFTFLPNNGKPIVGDVGGSIWEEVDVIEKGGNYGWPTAEGTCSNCPFINPVFTYHHTDPPDNAGSITSTMIYTGSTLPTQYNNVFFYGDYTLGFIKYLVFDPQFTSVISDNQFDNNAGSVVQLTQGPDGNIYQLNFIPGALYKIGLSGGNHAPVVQMQADPIAGLRPLTVNFTSTGTFDQDNNPLSYLWDFGDSGTATGSAATHTYNINGTYAAKLTVSDGQKNATASATITVGNRLPTGTITSPINNSKYNAGDTISYSGTGSDPEDGNLPASAFQWDFIFHHALHIHPYFHTVTGVKSGTFPISTITDNLANTYYEVKLTVTDSGGLKHVSSTFIYPNLVNLTFKTNNPNLYLTVDGLPFYNTYTEQAVVGVVRGLDAPSPQFIGSTQYDFGSWSDGGAKAHQITTPATDTTYTVNFNGISLPPAPWVNTDIGARTVAGSSTYNNGLFTIKGGGNDIWDTTDEFRYTYQPLNGDGTIIAKVSVQANTDPWAKSGVMIKESATLNAKYAAIAVTPGNGIHFQYNFTGDQSGGAYTFPVWLKLTRTGSTFTAAKSVDGTNWTSIGTTTLAMNSNATIGLFVSAHIDTALNTSTFDNVNISTSAFTLPSPWTNTDIGAPAIAGSASFANNIFTVQGAGNDIWGTTDQFQFVKQPLNGDGEIVTKVTSQTNTDPWAKAGVMIKESTTPLSKYVMVMVSPANGLHMQYNFTGDQSGGTFTMPIWLKLKRVGNVFTSYRSTDGTNFTQIGSTTLTVNSNALVGLFVSSHNGPVLNTSTFSNVAVNAAPATSLPAPWVNTDVGNPSLAGSSTYNSGTFSVQGAGSDIWGTTDQFQYTYQPHTGDGTIMARVKSQTGTEPWAKSGIMIKSSTTANTPYALVAITPGNGIKFQYNFNGDQSGGGYTLPNAWLKLTRVGNTLTAFSSANGVNWTQIGSASVTLPANTTFGLFASSHYNLSYSSSDFDNVSVTP